MIVSKTLMANERLVSVTPEGSHGMRRFSIEQKEALEQEGYVFYGLTRQSIKTLRDNGHKFHWGTSDIVLQEQGFNLDFLSLRSMHSEVAIKPNELYLPDSDTKVFSDQVVMVDRFSQELRNKVSGVKAVIGELSDYAELAYAHLDARKEFLFGPKYGYRWVNTKTIINANSSEVGNAIVGYTPKNGGEFCYDWHLIWRNYRANAVPLVIPV